MKITRIEIQKKNKKRYNLYLDNEFRTGIHEDVLVMLGLHVNQQITEEIYEDIILKELYAKAKSEALHFISYRMRSTSEVVKKLSEYEEEVINETLDFLNEHGFLNDKEFIKAFIHDKATISRHSMTKIKYELKKIGLPTHLVEQVVNDYVDQEIDFDFDNAKVLSLKKFKQLLAKDKYNEYELKQRVYQSLTQKGYNIYLVKDALNKALEEEPIE
jgi:regulatory protein